MTLKEFFIHVFSEDGIPSCKRIVGTFMIVVVMICTVLSIVTSGMSTQIQSIVELEIITAGTLLGLSSVTRIWNKSQSSSNTESKSTKKTKQQLND